MLKIQEACITASLLQPGVFFNSTDVILRLLYFGLVNDSEIRDIRLFRGRENSVIRLVLRTVNPDLPDLADVPSA